MGTPARLCIQKETGRSAHLTDEDFCRKDVEGGKEFKEVEEIASTEEVMVSKVAKMLRFGSC